MDRKKLWCWGSGQVLLELESRPASAPRQAVCGVLHQEGRDKDSERSQSGAQHLESLGTERWQSRQVICTRKVRESMSM